MSFDANQEEEDVKPVETDVESQEQPQEEVQEAPPKSREYNFERLRRKVEEKEQLIDQMARELQELKAKSTPAARDELAEIEQEIEALDDDDSIEASKIKKLKRLLEKRAEMIAESAAERVVQKRTFMDRILRDHPDFNQVVNAENAQKLLEIAPWLAPKFNQNDEDANRLAYSLIKNSQFYQPRQSQQASEEVARLKKNESLPKVAASASPLASAAPFQQRSKQDLWKEMQEAASRR